MHKKILSSGTIKIIILNGETEDIMKIVKALEDSVLLLNAVSEQFKIKQKTKTDFVERIRYIRCEVIRK